MKSRQYPGIVFLDADVCLHAAIPSSPAHQACAWVMTEIAYGRINAAIDVEVIREILSRLRQAGERDKAYTFIESLMQLIPIQYPVNIQDIRLAAALSRMPEAQRLRPSECIHLAVMQHHGLNTIISMDSAYDEFPELTRWDPQALYEEQAAATTVPSR